MSYFKRSLFAFLLVICCASNLYSQEKAIGSWNSFMPYTIANGIVTNGNEIYAICPNAFFVYPKPRSEEFNTYSKVSGMADVGTSLIGYDMATSKVIIVYSNGNIDVFKDNTFYNIPDFKLKTISGSKAVFGVFCYAGYAYISTSVGILAVNLDNFKIEQTYQLYYENQTQPVYGLTVMNGSFYAITGRGLYSAPTNSPDLQNLQVWTHVDSTSGYQFIAGLNSTLYIANNSNIYAFTQGDIQNIYTSPTSIMHIDAGLNCLLVSEQNSNAFTGSVKKLNETNTVVDSAKFVGFPNQALQLADSAVWIANSYNGLEFKANNTVVQFNPAGPNDINSFCTFANDGDLWIAHGGYSDLYLPNNNGSDLSHFSKNVWNNLQTWSYGPFADSLLDFVSVVKDETNGYLYAASFGGYGFPFGTGGLFELHPDQTSRIYKNDVFQQGTSSGGWEIAGLTLDNNNNLWVTTYTSKDTELYVKEKSTGNWYSYFVNVTRNPPHDGGPIVADDYGDVWYVCMYGQGLMGYSTNNTLSDPTDDAWYHLTTGVGSGNLPSNNTLSIAKDLTGNIWVGTDNGIGIIYQPSGCISGKCDGVIPIVQYDAYAGYLFAGQNVRAIAVDGANRKWVGTDNGVWLLTPDASSIVYKFTSDNSPLPSNHIQSISIDKATGDVYFGTDQGLVSYHGDATQGGDSNSSFLAYPNPVPSGYKGTIAIKGLVANADVKITDVDGQLVYHTTAFGGQAIWSGYDYKGHRPASGVYLVFITNTSNSTTDAQAGSQTYVGKLVFKN